MRLPQRICGSADERQPQAELVVTDGERAQLTSFSRKPVAARIAEQPMRLILGCFRGRFGPNDRVLTRGKLEAVRRA
jgi:hypothetical protein